jgi:MOSC domain-containing protein YiiM
MKLLSVNVGLPREIEWQGKLVRTSIFKSPVPGNIRVSALNLAGDEQSDLSVHGGVHKAVYVYPFEHYEFWHQEIPGLELKWGAFGENFTSEGWLEGAVHVGDRFRIGSAEFVITQPRLPCYKLGIRFGRPDIVKRFLRSGRSGFYLAVIQEGQVKSGDSIELLAPDAQEITVSEILELYTTDAANHDLLRRSSELSALPEYWRDHFRKRLWDPDA